MGLLMACRTKHDCSLGIKSLPSSVFKGLASETMPLHIGQSDIRIRAIVGVLTHFHVRQQAEILESLAIPIRLTSMCAVLRTMNC
jgi:hypothetical protein